MLEFSIPLSKIYLTQGFINIPVVHEKHFGQNNQYINVFLEKWENIPLNSKINRVANINRSPRIMIGRHYSQWVQATHTLGDNITVTLNNPLFPNSILIK